MLEPFQECKEGRLGDVVILAIMTGMRLRNIFPLEWSAVNLAEGVLSVRKSIEEISKKTAKAVDAPGTLNEKPPKTRKSKRAITLSCHFVLAHSHSQSVNGIVDRILRPWFSNGFSEQRPSWIGQHEFSRNRHCRVCEIHDSGYAFHLRFRLVEDPSLMFDVNMSGFNPPRLLRATTRFPSHLHQIGYRRVANIGHQMRELFLR